MGQIHSIVYQPLDREYADRLDNFIRIPIETARLIVNHGSQAIKKPDTIPYVN